MKTSQESDDQEIYSKEELLVFNIIVRKGLIKRRYLDKTQRRWTKPSGYLEEENFRKRKKTNVKHKHVRYELMTSQNKANKKIFRVSYICAFKS